MTAEQASAHRWLTMHHSVSASSTAGVPGDIVTRQPSGETPNNTALDPGLLRRLTKFKVGCVRVCMAFFLSSLVCLACAFILSSVSFFFSLIVFCSGRVFVSARVSVFGRPRASKYPVDARVVSTVRRALSPPPPSPLA